MLDKRFSNKWMAESQNFDFVDMWLAEAWVELSSQRILMTDDDCKNTVTTALSAKEVGTLDLFWHYWVEASEEDLLETRPRSIKRLFWWGVNNEMTARSCERRRELEQSKGC